MEYRKIVVDWSRGGEIRSDWREINLVEVDVFVTPDSDCSVSGLIGLNGRVFVSWVRNSHSLGGSRGVRREVKEREGVSHRSMIEALSRARSKVRKFIFLHGLDYMLTLTFPGEGVHDWDMALDCWQSFRVRFFSRVLRRPFLMVPELHPGGHGYHLHVATTGPWSKEEIDVCRRLWTSVVRNRAGLSPSGGAKWVRVHLKRFDGDLGAYGYLSKYLGKSIGEGVERGKHRYFSSRPRWREIPLGWSAKVQPVSVTEVYQCGGNFHFLSRRSLLGRVNEQE